MDGSILDLVPSGLVAKIPCNGAEHDVGWSSGCLRARSHDATSEDVLNALAGDRPTCAQIGYDWDAHKLEPLLIAAMIKGHAGLLSRQSYPTIRPPVSWRRTGGIYQELAPFIAFPPELRRVLAADAAIAYSATDYLTNGIRDDTMELRQTVQRLMAAAAGRAFGHDAEVQIEATTSQMPASLFVRSADPFLVVGRVPVAWAALAVLGLDTHEDVLVLDLRLAGSQAQASGFTYRRGDRDLTTVNLLLTAEQLRTRVAEALQS